MNKNIFAIIGLLISLSSGVVGSLVKSSVFIVPLIIGGGIFLYPIFSEIFTKNQKSEVGNDWI